VSSFCIPVNLAISIKEQSECRTPTIRILSLQDLPLQGNHDENGSFWEIHLSDKNGDEL
jgi:hypothetical protein